MKMGIFTTHHEKIIVNPVENCRFIEYASQIRTIYGMSVLATVIDPPSRPKVHRFPANTQQQSRKRSTVKILYTLVTAGGAVMVAALLITFLNGMIALTGKDSLIKGSAPTQALVAKVPSVQGKQPDNVLVMKDETGKIVGQMTKIPPQTEQASGIKSFSEVDNKAGRDLLSILSK